MDTHEYRHLIDELLAQRRSSGEDLADAALEFKQASQRYVAAYDKALKAGWSRSQLSGFPDPAKPVRANARRPRRKARRKLVDGLEDSQGDHNGEDTD